MFKKTTTKKSAMPKLLIINMPKMGKPSTKSMKTTKPTKTTKTTKKGC